MYINPITINKNITIQSFGHKNEYSTLTKKQKGIVLTASAVGTIAALAACGKAKNINIFKLSELKKLDFGSKEIFALATGSLVGGLSAGIIVDKTNKQDKIRESLQQFVGNILFPISFVAIANSLYNKCTKKIKLPQINNKLLNAVIKSTPQVVITLLSLGLGIIVGNKFANNFNNKIFKEKEDRKVKISDFAAHVDDTLLGATLVARNLSNSSTSIVGAAASKLIPPALIVPGYMTGTASRKHH